MQAAAGGVAPTAGWREVAWAGLCMRGAMGGGRVGTSLMRAAVLLALRACMQVVVGSEQAALAAVGEGGSAVLGVQARAAAGEAGAVDGPLVQGVQLVSASV
ncbi:MAG: hypothetical protein ACK4ZJ_20210, partial [Allorhizobium sp.]